MAKSIYRGVFDAEKSYPIYSIVNSSEAKDSAMMISVQDVPVGSDITDANYWITYNVANVNMLGASGGMTPEEVQEMIETYVGLIEDLDFEADDIVDAINFLAENIVQADWNEDDTESMAFIKNKPTIPVQANADWNENDSAEASYIENKPFDIETEYEYTVYADMSEPTPVEADKLGYFDVLSQNIGHTVYAGVVPVGSETEIPTFNVGDKLKIEYDGVVYEDTITVVTNGFPTETENMAKISGTFEQPLFVGIFPMGGWVVLIIDDTLPTTAGSTIDVSDYLLTGKTKLGASKVKLGNGLYVDENDSISARITNSEMDSQNNANGNVLTADGNGGADWLPPTRITVDSAMSSTSENPVQNKVIASAISPLVFIPPDETPVNYTFTTEPLIHSNATLAAFYTDGSTSKYIEIICEPDPNYPNDLNNIIFSLGRSQSDAPYGRNNVLALIENSPQVGRHYIRSVYVYNQNGTLSSSSENVSISTQAGTWGIFLYVGKLTKINMLVGDFSVIDTPIPCVGNGFTSTPYKMEAAPNFNYTINGSTPKSEWRILTDTVRTLTTDVNEVKNRVASNVPQSTETTTPTVAEFNALLTALKNAGLMTPDVTP